MNQLMQALSAVSGYILPFYLYLFMSLLFGGDMLEGDRENETTVSIESALREINTT